MALTSKFARLGGASLLALSIGMASAEAATLVGLTADNKLVKIDTATMAASAPMAISGTDRIVGIDVRPADGKLWGLTETGQLVTIDHMSGKATAGSMLSEKVSLGPRPVVDFNPVADRLRVIGADGVSLRINVETGATTVDKPLNFDAADAMPRTRSPPWRPAPTPTRPRAPRAPSCSMSMAAPARWCCRTRRTTAC